MYVASIRYCPSRSRSRSVFLCGASCGEDCAAVAGVVVVLVVVVVVVLVVVVIVVVVIVSSAVVIPNISPMSVTRLTWQSRDISPCGHLTPLAILS
jgi:hypothetical protein